MKLTFSLFSVSSAIDLVNYIFEELDHPIFKDIEITDGQEYPSIDSFVGHYEDWGVYRIDMSDDMKSLVFYGSEEDAHYPKNGTSMTRIHRSGFSADHPYLGEMMFNFMFDKAGCVTAACGSIFGKMERIDDILSCPLGPHRTLSDYYGDYKCENSTVNVDESFMQKLAHINLDSFSGYNFQTDVDGGIGSFTNDTNCVKRYNQYNLTEYDGSYHNGTYTIEVVQGGMSISSPVYCFTLKNYGLMRHEVELFSVYEDEFRSVYDKNIYVKVTGVRENGTLVSIKLTTDGLTQTIIAKD